MGHTEKTRKNTRRPKEIIICRVMGVLIDTADFWAKCIGHCVVFIGGIHVEKNVVREREGSAAPGDPVKEIQNPASVERERFLQMRQDTFSENSAQGMEFPCAVLADDGIDIGRHESHELVRKVSCEVGQIAGDAEQRIFFCGGQGGVQAGQGATILKSVRNAGNIHTLGEGGVIGREQNFVKV